MPAATRRTRSWAECTPDPASRSGQPSPSPTWRCRTRSRGPKPACPPRRRDPRMSRTTEENCDLLVVGSGAGGLSTAVTAARLGLDVLLIEKEAQFGGTTAWSGGWMWIPRNPLAVESGLREDIEAPKTYLRG